jgi:hypothetical protein
VRPGPRPLLVLGAVVAFLPSLWAGPVADDFTLLSTVDRVQGPLWPFARNDLGEGGDAGHFYRPLWVLANTVVLELSGGRTAALHALNLVLFALVVVQVHALAGRVAGRGALLAAGAFAVYPRHAESVAWISGNTDLIATTLGLGALLCVTAREPTPRRLAGAAALTAAAALAKESAFVLPFLGAVLAVARPPTAGGRWRAPAAMAAALVPVLVMRTVAIGGAGGYTEDPVTPGRVLASIASYGSAALTPHELELLRRPLLALLPLVLLALLVVGLRRLSVRGEQERLVVAAAGIAWFAVALAPVLGEPLDLNNATGERLLFLPSVGLALTLAALAPARPPRAVVALAAVAGLGLCLVASLNWVRAGDIAERSVREALELAPPRGGELVLLSVPESFRNAHVFTNSLDRAVARAGRPDLLISTCAPVHVRSTRAGGITFTPAAGGELLGVAEAVTPFDFPVTGEPGRLSNGCGYRRAPRGALWPGLRTQALVRPAPTRSQARLLAFDGDRVRAVNGPE